MILQHNLQDRHPIEVLLAEWKFMRLKGEITPIRAMLDPPKAADKDQCLKLYRKSEHQRYASSY
jgi:hypothetical protein